MSLSCQLTAVDSCVGSPNDANSMPTNFLSVFIRLCAEIN